MKINYTSYMTREQLISLREQVENMYPHEQKEWIAQHPELYKKMYRLKNVNTSHAYTYDEYGDGLKMTGQEIYWGED